MTHTPQKIKEEIEKFDREFITDGKLDVLITLGDSPDVVEPTDERYAKLIKNFLNNFALTIIESVREDVEEVVNQDYPVSPVELRQKFQEIIDEYEYLYELFR